MEETYFIGNIRKTRRRSKKKRRSQKRWRPNSHTRNLQPSHHLLLGLHLAIKQKLITPKSGNQREIDETERERNQRKGDSEGENVKKRRPDRLGKGGEKKKDKGERERDALPY